MENTPVRIEALLRIETLSDSEKEEFSIVNAKETEAILGNMAENISRVALYYNNASCFILTTVMGVDHSGFWLEQSPSSTDNAAILESDDLFLVSSHLTAKVEFAPGQAYDVEYDGYPAFYFYMPEEIYRLQRRECFRLDLPPSESLRCVIPVQPDKPTTGKQQSHQVAIMDISLGGVKLSCAEGELDLDEGQVYENCQIDLPNTGTIKVEITVRSLYIQITKSKQTIKRAGCQFTKIDGASSILLQRYLTNLQRAARARAE
ncbi:MAG: flagellar brake protein [Gallionellaceae bacterium]|jgi:c-di-GMP-binding flagellar brake protein YcgR|nr:flagellar brake protein [Gallionellaceae bacterium]